MRIKIIPLIIISCLSILQGFAQTKELKTEEKGFQWYMLTDGGYYGAEDKDGKTLIPLSRGYDLLYFYQGDEPEGYFGFWKGINSGACDVSGKEIIPPIYSTVYRHGGGSAPYYYVVSNEDNKYGICDESGKEIISPKFDYCSRHGGKDGEPYWYSISLGKTLNGACDMYGNIAVEPMYESVIYLDNNFQVRINGKWEDTEISLNSDGTASGTYNVPNYYVSNNNNTYSSNSTNTSTSTPSLKELFQEAYNTPDSEAQLKYDRYQKVLQADPSNYYGYKSLVYNNIGCLYESLGDKRKAKEYYEASLEVDPKNEKAKSNLKSVKREIRAENLSNFADALSAFSEGLQSGGNQGSYSGSSNNYQMIETSNNSSYSNSNRSSSGSSSSKGKKVNSQAIMNLERAYDGYESQLARMKSSGNYSKDEVRSIQRKMRETREKYNQMSGRTRSVSSYENWNP